MGSIMPIRPMNEADLPNVLALQNTLGFQKWNEKQFRSELRASYALCLVYEDAETFAGYAIFHLMGSDSELLTIAVDPKFQRKGIASSLLHEGLDKLNRENGDHCVLEVRQGDCSARSLYAKHGIQAYGQRARYYDDGETAILYRW